MPEKGITIEQRRANIQTFVDDYKTLLVSPRPPGSVLNNSECLGVAKCAREAYFSPSLDELPASVCLRPGTDFFAWMQEATCKFPSSIDISEEKGDFLAKTIHAIVGHQHRLDENWYKMTLKEILKIFEGGKGSMEEESVRVRCHAILCEIVIWTVVSHSIHLAFLGIGEEPPALPSEEEAEKATKSSGPAEPFDMMSFLKKVNWEKTVSHWSPYFLLDDINMESKEWKAMGETRQTLWKNQLKRNGKNGPRICIYFAPYDAELLIKLFYTLYMDFDKDLSMGTFKLKCGGVTRFQLETTVVGYTEAVSCAF